MVMNCDYDEYGVVDKSEFMARVTSKVTSASVTHLGDDTKDMRPDAQECVGHKARASWAKIASHGHEKAHQKIVRGNRGRMTHLRVTPPKIVAE